MARTRTTFQKGHPKYGGGKRTGSKGKKVILREFAQKLAAQGNKTPLEILTEIANGHEGSDIRTRAAAAAAPYVHRKMPQQIELSGELKIQSTFAKVVQEDDKE